MRRFLSPQVADMLTELGSDEILSSHRRRIAVVFCDLRGFTQLSDSAEPEEAMELLQQYHATLGQLVDRHDGTIDHRAGDGLMVFFNDPIPVDRAATRAVEMASAMRDQVSSLLAGWRRGKVGVGFGVGVSYGYATIGFVGYEGRFDYTANGNVVNLAARLCDRAEEGQIVVSRPVAEEIEPRARLAALGELELKGFRDPVEAFAVLEYLGTAETA